MFQHGDSYVTLTCHRIVHFSDKPVLLYKTFNGVDFYTAVGFFLQASDRVHVLPIESMVICWTV